MRQRLGGGKHSAGAGADRPSQASLTSSVELLKRLLDLPPDATFMGFGLECRLTFKFLCRAVMHNEPADGLWLDSPEHAVTFCNWCDALEAEAARATARLVLMFDLGDEIRVFPAR